MARWEVTPLEEIDELDDGREPFRPVRQHFGISSFGVNSWTGRTAGDRIINEHDEKGEHEELYVVLQGRATFELDGERVDAPAGTLVFAEPGVKRTAFAEEDGTTLIAIGGQPGEAYKVMGFELWVPFQKLYEAGKYDEIAEQAREPIEAQPEALGAFYNLACAEALAGRADDAAKHLRHAIENSEQLRDLAREDSDVASIRDRPEISELLA
jgi:mannose-6-phosphate isomerase-like protein (cupin superfamily)